MSYSAHVLAPSLQPNALLSISIPSQFKHRASKEPSEHVIVKQYEFADFDGQGSLGAIKKIAVGDKGKAKATEDVEGDDRWLAIADTSYRVSLAQLPPHPTNNDDPETNTKQGRTLQIHAQYTCEKVRKADKFVGLELLPSGILSTLSSGLLSLHSYPSSSDSPLSTQTTSLPSPLTHLQTVSSSTNTNPVHFLAAGKEVDVGLWDLERTLSKGGKGTKGDGAGKRKKGELEEGQVWGAKNLPNNYLSLRTPIHHLSLTTLPTFPSTSSSSDSETQIIPHLSIITGTQSGHVRRYDTRQRKPVGGWKVAREGGVGVVKAGEREHELFYADASSILGSIDLRTGRTLYTYTLNSTSTTHSIATLPSSPSFSSTSSSSFTSPKQLGLLSIGSDATMRFCSTTPPPEETKGNVKKGEILGSVGAVGVGDVCFAGWEQVEQDEEEEEEEDLRNKRKGRKGGDEDDEDEEDEEVWDDLKVVGVKDVEDEDEDSEEELDSEAEEEAFRQKRRKQEGRS